MKQILEDIINSLRSQQLLTKLALQVEFDIKTRTRQGISVEGTSFGQYSKAYAKKRQRKGLPVTPITLTFDDISGMLQQITNEVSADYSQVAVFIQKPEKELIMQYLSQMGAGKNKKIFHFWDLNDDEVKGLGEIVDKEIAEKFNLIKGTTL